MCFVNCCAGGYIESAAAIHYNQRQTKMKLLSKIQHIGSNVKTLWNAVSSDDVILGQRQVSNMMVDQLGAGWIDRLMAVRGKLHPDTVESIILNASSRTQGKLGDLYELMYYIENDPRLGGLLEKRVGAASRVITNIKPGNKDNPDSVDASHFLERYLEDIRLKNFLKAGMEGQKYGVTGFHNIIYEQGDKYAFRDPTDENQISQSRWWQERSGESEVWGKLYLKNLQGTKLYLHNESDIHPAQLTVFVANNKRGYYDTTGFMNRVLRMYVAKVWTMVFLVQSVERFGRPFVWSKLEEREFKDDAFKAKVERVLKNFGAERWGVFPAGFEIESLNTASATGADMHMSLLNFANVEMAVAIVGQNLSTEVQGGSFAAAASHAEVEEHITEDDVEWLEEEINDKFLYWLLRLNYPNMDEDDYPRLKLTPVKNVDVEKISRGFKSLTELVDVPTEEIRSAAQIRAPRLKEDADPDAVGAEKYDEEVVGPSVRNRARTGDQLIRALGG